MSDEYKLHTECVEHIRKAFPGLFFFHVPNQTRNATEAFFNKKLGVMPGVSDLLLTWQTGKLPWGAIKMAAIELKIKGGKVSTPQNKFLSAVNRIGWHTAVCRSKQEVHDALVKWGLKPVSDHVIEPNYQSQEDKFKDVFEAYKP